MNDDLSQEIHGNMMFSVYMYKCYKCDTICINVTNVILPFSKKNQR